MVKETHNKNNKKKIKRAIPKFYIKTDSGSMLKETYPNILDALSAAKRLCDISRKQLFVLKKVGKKYIDMGSVSFFYSDFYFSSDKKLRYNDFDENENNEDYTTKKSDNKVNESPLLSKSWDDFKYSELELLKK